MNFAVIGLGSFGVKRAKAIKSSKIAKLVYIFDPDENILPCEGMIIIIPAGRKHSAVYSGKTDRIMIGVNLSNTTTSQIKVDVQLNSIYLIKGVPIPANSALSPLDGKIVMKAGQVLTITSDTAASSDVAVSVLEIS